MNVFSRYFTVPLDSAVATHLQEILDQQQARISYFEKIRDDVGADTVHTYEGDLRFAGFKFGTNEADLTHWRKPERRSRLQQPRVVTPVGKALWERIKAAPACDHYLSCLNQVGLAQHWFGQLLNNLTIHRATLAYKKDTYLIVSVPWYEVDPEELAQHILNKEQPFTDYSNSNLDHLLWLPPEAWVEIKEWQVNKLIDKGVTN